MIEDAWGRAVRRTVATARELTARPDGAVAADGRGQDSGQVAAAFAGTDLPALQIVEHFASFVERQPFSSEEDRQVARGIALLMFLWGWEARS